MTTNHFSLAAIMSVVIFALPALAQNRADFKPFYLAPEVGYVLPTDGDIDDSIFIGGRFGWNVNESWALELESGWMELGSDFFVRGDDIDATVIPIMANVRWNGPRRDWGNWYVFGGVGAAINDLEDDEVGSDIEIDDSVAWQAGVGVKREIWERTSGFLDIRYFWNSPDAEGSSPLVGLIDDEADLQVILFTAGVEF